MHAVWFDRVFTPIHTSQFFHLLPSSDGGHDVLFNCALIRESIGTIEPLTRKGMTMKAIRKKFRIQQGFPADPRFPLKDLWDLSTVS